MIVIIEDPGCFLVVLSYSVMKHETIPRSNWTFQMDRITIIWLVVRNALYFVNIENGD